VELRQLALRRARRLTKQVMESLVGHSQAGDIVEIAHVQPEAAIIGNGDQLLFHEVCKSRLAIWCEPHNLVFAGIDLETEIPRERGIEQAQ